MPVLTPVLRRHYHPRRDRRRLVPVSVDRHARIDSHPSSPPRSRFDPPHHLPQKGTSSGFQSLSSAPPLWSPLSLLLPTNVSSSTTTTTRLRFSPSCVSHRSCSRRPVTPICRPLVRCCDAISAVFPQNVRSNQSISSLLRRRGTAMEQVATAVPFGV